MLKARPSKEVVVRLPNEIGTLNGIAKTLSDKAINIVAVSAWVEGADVIIRLLTDQTARAFDALKAQGYAVREVDVIVMELPHKPGMLRRVTDALSQDGLDIHHLYATSAAGQEQSLVVFTTANNDKAIVRLNAERR
jgi:hypothetical protein